MKFIKNILISSVLLAATTSLASDYDANYYEDEGALLFKIRGAYTDSSAKIKKATLNNAENPGNFIENGYGLDVATTYFFSDNIATELSLGVSLLRVKNSAIKKASLAFGNGAGNVGKNNDIFFLPLAATIQYHVAPFGAIRPYVGGGYHGAYLYTRSKAIKIDPGHGGVLQAGVDFIAKDDTLFTLDVRQYFLKSKLTLRKEFLFPGGLAASNVSSKTTMNPLVVSLGFGFKF